MLERTPPIVRFHTMIAGIQSPTRADRSAAGTLPTRAYRYCEAVTSASSFGWWIFPPIDLALLWDGADCYWNFGDHCSDWLPLQPSAQFPNFAARFDAEAPHQVRGYSPPLLTALPEPGVIQIWTGLCSRTAPGWSLLLRAPANLPSPGGFTLYEGMIETDRWFGPLFTNLRLTRTHAPVRLRADYPFLQAQPVPRVACADDVLSSIDIRHGLGGLEPSDWNDYTNTVVLPNQDPKRGMGSYSAGVRRRARHACCPVAEHRHRQS